MRKYLSSFASLLVASIISTSPLTAETDEEFPTVKIGFLDLKEDVRYDDWGIHPVDIRSATTIVNRRAYAGAQLAIKELEQFTRIAKAYFSILEIFGPKVTLFRLLQFDNTPSLITFRIFGSSMAVKLLHPEKASKPMLVTLSGILIVLRLLTPSKELRPIDFTESVIVKLVRPLCREKALLPIDVTKEGTVYSPLFPSGYVINSVLFLLNNTPFSEV